MTDDNITRLHPKPRPVRLDNLRRPRVPADGDADEMEKLGLDPRAWPHTDGSTRIGCRTLRELRERARQAGEQAAEAELANLAAAGANHLARIEIDTLVKRLTEVIGDGPDDKGAA